MGSFRSPPRVACQQHTNSWRGESGFFDSLQFRLQGCFDFRGSSFSPGNATYVGPVDPKLSGHTAVKAAIELISLEVR